MDGQLDLFTYQSGEYRIEKPIRLIELFAGVGAQAMALRDLGADFETQCISEWNIYSNRSYKAIHNADDDADYSDGMEFQGVVDALCDIGISTDGKTPLTREQIARRGDADCRKIYNEFRANRNIGSIMNRKGEDLGITDIGKFEYIMTYSFPCQDISNAGKRQGMEKGSGTRSGLLWEVERLLGELDSKPQVLVMENVPAVHGKKNMADFQKWMDCLGRMGYTNHWQDLNARDFGVPQSRNRTFMVSILGEYAYTFPKPITLKRRMKDCLEGGVDRRYYMKPDRVRKLIDRMIADGSLAVGSVYANTSDDFFHGVLEDGSISRTVKAEKHDLSVVEQEEIPCFCDKKVGDDFRGMDDIGIRSIGTSTAGAICARHCKDASSDGDNMVLEVKKVGNINGYTGGSYSGCVYDAHGISPTINTCSSGNTEPMILEDGTRNPVRVGYMDSGTGKHQSNTVYSTDGISPSVTTLQGGTQQIKVLEDRQIVAMRGRNPDNPSDRTSGIHTEQRAEIAERGITNTITTVAKDNMVLEAEADGDGASYTMANGATAVFRIRKLTPRECWRLMDFKDSDFDRAAAVNSGTQLYSQAGNSLVRKVMAAIFSQLNMKGVMPWNERTDAEKRAT